MKPKNIHTKLLNTGVRNEDMHMSKKEDKANIFFRAFPNCVSDHPKKVISVMVVFTLFMGFFAAGMEMDTSEEAFQPDSPKQEYLLTIREKFGRGEESVQVSFTADDGDVFTVDVFQDMLDFEEELAEDEMVGPTLASSDELPTGINTLASNVLMANQSLLIEESIIQQGEESDEMLRAVEKQTEMYHWMNESLSINLGATHIFQEKFEEDHIFAIEGVFGGNRTLISMSNIVSNPESWMVMEEYGPEFEELIDLLNPESCEEPLTNVTYALGEWSSEMKDKRDDMEEKVSGLDHFLELVDGTRDMLNASIGLVEEEDVDFQDEKEFPRFMTLAFFAKAEAMGHLEGLDMDMAEEELPSLELSLDERQERLGNMTDHDVKKTVSDVVNYDQTRLNESVDMGVDNFNEMSVEAEKGLEHLNNVEELLGLAIEEYEAVEDEMINFTYAANNLREGYLEAVKENQTLVDDSKEMYVEARELLQFSRRLGPMMDQMGDMIRTVVSSDFAPTTETDSIEAKATLAMVMMDSEIDTDDMLDSQLRIIDIGDEVAENSKTRVSAMHVMMEEINESANRSLERLLPIAVVMVVIILFIVFRSFFETALSLGSLAIAIVWTIGFGVMLGYEFNPMIIVVPILITGLVIDYGIHMVMRYREEKEEGYQPKAATNIAIVTVGGALVLTTFTTAVGFLSNRLSDIQAMQQFGVLAAVGIISSFFLMTAFLPAVLELYDERREKKSKKPSSKRDNKDQPKEKEVISDILSKSADAADRYPLGVLLVVLLITSGSVYGVLNIDSTFNMEDFLPEDRPQSKNIQYIYANFEITTSYAYILTEGEIDSSDYLYALHETRENIRDSRIVGGDGGDVRSPLTVLQNYGKAIPGSPDYNHTIVRMFSESDINDNGVTDQNVTELYGLLFEFEESRDHIEGVLHRSPEGRYDTGLIRLTEDMRKINEDLDNAAILEEELERDVEPLEHSYTTKITSNSMLSQEATSELTATQVNSLIETILVVAVLLTVVFYFLHKSLMLGVITTAPVAMITLWIIGTMYLLGVSLNVMTVTITALTVGMGVDYSIHITHRFTEELSNSDLYETVHETVQKTGGALFGSAATTVAAFAILSTSDILPLSQFGYITALALTYSFLASVFILPSALMLWAKFNRKNKH